MIQNETEILQRKLKIEDLIKQEKSIQNTSVSPQNSLSGIIIQKENDTPEYLSGDLKRILKNTKKEISRRQTINNSITSNHINHTKSIISLLDHSNSFSIKNENIAQERSLASGTLSNFETETTNKVIVYNISDEFLIQMTIIGTENDPNYIKLQYQYKNEEIVLNKNDIFYQPIETFETFGSFSQLKIVNELSVLKNIQMRLLNQKPFCYIGDIFMMINKEDISYERDFFLEEFLNHLRKEDVLIYRSCFDKTEFLSNDSREINFFYKYLHLKKANRFLKYIPLFSKIFNLFNINKNEFDSSALISNQDNVQKNKVRLMFSFTFEDSINFNFIPIMSSSTISNDLYVRSILFDNNSTIPHYNKENTISLHPEINILLRELYLNKQNTNKTSFISQNLINVFLSNSHNVNVLNMVYEIFNIANISKYFVNVAKMILLSYVAFNPAKIFCENSNVNLNVILGCKSDIIDHIHLKNMVFYSNLLVLLLFKYINNLLTIQFANNNNPPYFSQDSSNHINDIIIFFNSSNREDDIILNEVIKQKTETTLCSTNQNSISKYISLYLNDNISKFIQNLTIQDKEFITALENNIFDISFLKSLYGKTTSVLKLFKLAYSISINNFSKYEEMIGNISQVWHCEIGYPYDNFFSTQETIIEFLQLTQIIEYCIMYNNYYRRMNINFFRTYQIRSFFLRYLPILTDIDTKYNPKKLSVYVKALNNFINDIQVYQGIHEKYIVNEKVISISYQTFEILNMLLKAIYDEKAKIIQKNFRRFVPMKLISNLRSKCIVIQKFFRMKRYKELSREFDLEHHNILSNEILSRYKSKDPIIIHYVISTIKKYHELQKENQTLNEFLNSDIINENEIQDAKKLSNAKSSNDIIGFPKDEKEEIIQLKSKLSKSRAKFKNLVLIIAEYEKKMENFVKMINSNREVKEVLYKHGITIN